MTKPAAQYLLLIEDNPLDYQVIRHELAPFLNDHELVWLKSCDEFFAHANQHPWAAILSDYDLADGTAEEVIKWCQSSHYDGPLIIVSGQIDDMKAVQLMKMGINDYVMKEHLKRLLPALEREIADAKTRRERSQARLRIHQLQMRNKNMLEMLPHGVGLITQKRILYLNELARNILNIDSHYRDISLATVLTKESKTLLIPQLETLLNHGNAINRMEIRIHRGGGEERQLILSARRYHEENIVAAQILFEDITEFSEIRRQNRLWQRVFDNSSEGIVITDHNSQILSVNDSLCKITGYSREELVGNNPRLFASGKHSNQFYWMMYGALLAEGFWQGKITNKKKDGTLYDEWVTISAVRDDDLQLTHFLALSYDLTEREQAKRQLDYLSSHDPVTGLKNKEQLLIDIHHMLDIAEHAVSKPTFALLMVGIEKYARLVQVLGHTSGELLAMEVSARLKAQLKHEDSIYRVSDDSFAIIGSPDPDPISRYNLSQQIHTFLSTTLTLSGESFPLVPHIGISTSFIDAADAEELVAAAETALNYAMTTGEQIMHYNSDWSRNIQEEFRLQNQLSNAISDNQLFMLYQPKFDLKKGLITSVEALVRWKHPELGVLSPDRFIPLAEQNGDIIKLGRWVIYEVARQLADWESKGLDIRVALNLSAQQIAHPSLITDIIKATAEYKVAKGKMGFEVTESQIIQSPERAQRILERIKVMGAEIHLDDFGTGYSSMAYLTRLPLNSLKIDKSFIDHLEQNHNDKTVVIATIELAHRLGLYVIAEGVETQEQLNLLREHGCDLIQGYFISRPVAAEQVAKLLADYSQCPLS